MKAVIDRVESKLIDERLRRWIAMETAMDRPPSQRDIAKMRESLEGRGGITWLARALGLKKQAISRWHRVPIERVTRVSQLTGIPRHEVRPDKPELFPHPPTRRKVGA